MHTLSIGTPNEIQEDRRTWLSPPRSGPSEQPHSQSVHHLRSFTCPFEESPALVVADGAGTGLGGVFTPGVSTLGGGVSGGGKSSGRGGGNFPSPCRDDAFNIGLFGAFAFILTKVGVDEFDNAGGVEGGEEAPMVAL